jgi:autotransporter translocation and assembly factor TamB
MKTTFLAFVALICFTLVAAAADVTGKWTADVPGRGGNAQTNTFTFKASGAKLEGSVTNQRGDSPIAEGKVDGDNISFVQNLDFGGNSIKITYKGVVKGDTIEFTREVEGRGGPATFTAKKAN